MRTCCFGLCYTNVHLKLATGQYTVNTGKYMYVNMQCKFKLLWLFPVEGFPCKQDRVLVVQFRG